MRRFLLLAVLAAAAALAACSGPEGVQKSDLARILPDGEESNVSLWHEETTAKRMAEASAKKDWLVAASNGAEHLATSMGSDLSGELFFQMGSAMREAVKVPGFENWVSNLDKAKRNQLRAFVDAESHGSYSNYHWNAVLNQRKNYDRERLIAAELWVPQLQAVEGSNAEATLRANKAMADQIFRRYPDVPGFVAKLDDPAIFPPSFQSNAADRAAWSNWRTLATPSSLLPAKELRAVAHPFAQVRNRPHSAICRTLLVLPPWYEVTVVGSAPEVGDPNSPPDTWTRVLWGDGKTGWVETRYLAPSGAEISTGREGARFRGLLAVLDRGNDLETAEKVASFLNGWFLSALYDAKASALLHFVHARILARASSLDNPNTRYVLAHPAFFRWHGDRQELALSDLLLRHVAKKSPQSPYLYGMELLP